MTGQIADRFFYQHEQYQLVGMNGHGLPTPFEFGLQPVMMHTACYRGYYCDYTIRDEHLSLVRYAETPAEAWGILRDFYRLPEKT